MGKKLHKESIEKISGGFKNQETNYKTLYENMSFYDLERDIMKLTQDKINAQKKVSDINSSVKMEIPINPLELQSATSRVNDIDQKLSAAKLIFDSKFS